MVGLLESQDTLIALIPSGILRILGALCWEWGQRTNVFLLSVPPPGGLLLHPALEAGITGVHGGATDRPCWSFLGSLALHGGPAPKQLLPQPYPLPHSPRVTDGPNCWNPSPPLWPNAPIPDVFLLPSPGRCPAPRSRQRCDPREGLRGLVVASVLLTLRFLLRQSRHKGVSSGVQSTYLGQPKQWMVNTHDSKAEAPGHGTCRRGPLGEPPVRRPASSALPSSSWGRGF